MSSFPSIWSIPGLNEYGQGQGQDGMDLSVQGRSSSSSRPATSHQGSGSTELSTSMVPTSQGTAYVPMFLAGTDGTAIHSFAPKIGSSHTLTAAPSTSRSTFDLAAMGNTPDLVPALQANSLLAVSPTASQPSSQHVQHANLSQDQLSHPHHSSIQSQQPHQSQSDSQRVLSSASDLLQYPLAQPPSTLPPGQHSTVNQMFNIAADTGRIDTASHHHSAPADPSASFTVPPGLYESHYPGLFYGALQQGSQSTLADTSLDSVLINSQEQSFSSFTISTSQSVLDSQGSVLGALDENATSNDQARDGAFSMLGASGQPLGQRRTSSGAQLNVAVAESDTKTRGSTTADSLDTPPQHSSSDTVEGDGSGQDEMQTTPQGNAAQSTHAQACTAEELSPSLHAVNAQGEAVLGPHSASGVGDTHFTAVDGSLTRDAADSTTAGLLKADAASLSQFLVPPGLPILGHQAFSSQPLPEAAGAWQPSNWMSTSPSVGFDTATSASAMDSGSMPAPVTSSGNRLSPTGSTRSTFDASTFLGPASANIDRRGRSSTISVTPDLYVPPSDTRPRSSTSSAGSNLASFTPPAPHSTGMSRSNSSVSLAVFQPLEQLNISGGRPGTAGSAQGSINSNSSGQFGLQRPASGGYLSVVSPFGSSGSAVQGLGYGSYGAVGAQHGRFQQGEPLEHTGDYGGLNLASRAGDVMASPSSWQAPTNRLAHPVGSNVAQAGMAAPNRKAKLRRAPSTLTLDSSYTSSLSTTSFSPASYGLPSANPSEPSPQFEQFPSMPSSSTSSAVLGATPATAPGLHFPVPHGGNHSTHPTFNSNDCGIAYPTVLSTMANTSSEASQLGLGAPSSKTPGSGYQTPTIMEEDESRMMQNVVSMALIPAQLFQSTASAHMTPSMPSGAWAHGGFMGSAPPTSSDGTQSHSSASLLGTASQATTHYDVRARSVSAPEGGRATDFTQVAGPMRPHLVQDILPARFGGSTATAEDIKFGLQPSTLHHAVPTTMASKFGPSGIPPALSVPFASWTEYKTYLRDIVCEYLATPSRLGLGERQVTIMTPKVGPKSYGTEKRFLCPPPLVMLSGNSWWTADPRKLMASQTGGQDDLSLAHRQGGNGAMSVLAPPIVSVKMLSEANAAEATLQWTSSDGRLIEHQEGLADKIPVAGRCLARHIYISEMSDDRRKPVYATVTISMPGPERPIELATLQSPPIKVISKANRKRQGVKHFDLSIHHGSTVCLFHRIKSQSLSTRFLCVSGPPTWIKGSDGRPFLKSSMTNPQTGNDADSSASFVVKTVSWDSFIIYAVDPSISTDEASQQAPLKPNYPPPPAAARPLRVDGEPSVPILYNQPVVLQCMNTGVTSPVMTIRAVEHQKVALGGLPVSNKLGGSSSRPVAEAPGEPVSHNHRIALEILDGNGDNAVEPFVEGDPNCTPGRSGQFLACLQEAVGLRLCGPRRWLPQPTQADSITDADQPRSATPMLGANATTTQAAFIAAVAAAQTRNSLAQTRSTSISSQALCEKPGSASGPSFERPSSSDGGKVRRPRRVSSSAVVPKDRTSGPGRGRRRGQSLSTVGLGPKEPVEPHLRTSASSKDLRPAAATSDSSAIAVSAGCRWMTDVAESDIWSIIGTEQATHTFYLPPAIQNGYLPPPVDLGPELSHLVRTPTPGQPISPLPVLSNWTYSTTSHLGADFPPGRETVELHGEHLSKSYLVFFADWESEVIDVSPWRIVCTPPPAWDENGVVRTELPVTLIREDGIIIPTAVTLVINHNMTTALGPGAMPPGFDSFNAGGGVPTGNHGSASAVPMLK